jgi:hypothetical protein
MYSELHQKPICPQPGVLVFQELCLSCRGLIQIHSQGLVGAFWLCDQVFA